MKNNYFIQSLLAITLTLSGCASVGVTTMKAASPKPKDCAVEIYSSPSEIKRPYETVCLIDSRTGTTAFHTKTGANAIQQTKAYACQCGADAILINNVQTDGVTMATWGKGSTIVKGIRYTN